MIAQSVVVSVHFLFSVTSWTMRKLCMYDVGG